LLKDKLKKVFASLFLSIVISKVIYYSLKFALISFTLLNDRLFSTPLYFQLMAAVLLSTYIYLVNRTSTK
jgi:hypothetical protein